MRWLVVSDSHGDTTSLRQAVERENMLSAPDGLLFLGDGLHDLDSIKPLIPVIHAVRGNCDLFGAQDEETVSLGGVRVLLCHGHSRYVKIGLDRLLYRAQEADVQVALYGHTHRPHCEWVHGVLLFNPGAMNMGRYAVLSIEANGMIDGQLKTL